MNDDDKDAVRAARKVFLEEELSMLKKDVEELELGLHGQHKEIDALRYVMAYGTLQSYTMLHAIHEILKRLDERHEMLVMPPKGEA